MPFCDPNLGEQNVTLQLFLYAYKPMTYFSSSTLAQTSFMVSEPLNNAIIAGCDYLMWFGSK